MIFKIFGLAATSLLGVALTAALPSQGPDEPPPPSKKAKKEDRAPDELKKAYDLLRRVRADNRTTGRPEDRLRDWTDRATQYYRDGVKSAEKGDESVAREFGLAAHDLARAVDHVRNAGSFNLDDELPPPPAAGPDGEDERTHRDLRHAHDRIIDLRDDAEGGDSIFYLEASKDLYNAARRDAVARRTDRAGELARAAEALTHVPEHLAIASDPKGRPEPKAKKARRDRPEGQEKPEPKEKKEKREKGEPKEKKDRDADEGGELPPPID